MSKYFYVKVVHLCELFHMQNVPWDQFATLKLLIFLVLLGMCSALHARTDWTSPLSHETCEVM